MIDLEILEISLTIGKGTYLNSVLLIEIIKLLMCCKIVH